MQWSSRPLLVATVLAVVSMCAAAENVGNQNSTLLALPLELQHLNAVWARAEGDLNGDGRPDLALVLTGSKGDGPREERLVVLVGDAIGGHKVLSVSGELCHPSKFYNLDIKNGSVFVQSVEYADAARFSAFTLQFRYSSGRQDLELIGEQTDEEDYGGNSSYRTSLNYLTKLAIHTRQAGKRRKEARALLNTSSPALPLKAFDCRSHAMTESPVHIDEGFKVHRKQSGSR
jgi:hypothetical protein